jgi:hypothetical protein
MSEKKMPNDTKNSLEGNAVHAAALAPGVFELIFENADGYFMGRTQVSVRVGLSSVHSVSFPMSHVLYERALALTAETVEEFYDAEVAPRILAGRTY